MAKVICPEHGISRPCPLCEADCWPTRDLKAVADFAGQPVNHPNGLIPGVKYVRLSTVIRMIGRRWAEIERVKAEVLRPLYTTKNRLVHEARFAKGAIDIGKLEKACIALGKGATTDEDPVVNEYMRVIQDDNAEW